MINNDSDSPDAAVNSPKDTKEYGPGGDVPGALRSEVWLTLQTRHAQQVFMGRRATADKPYIIGLTRFGAILSQLQVCVYADDPYADWWLIKVEEALQQTAQEVEALRQALEQRLSDTPGMEVKIAESLHPVKVPLQFRNPFAHAAARILADFDTLARALLTARHVGLMDRREAERCMRLGARALRRAMGAAFGYKYEGVKRQDVREANARAQQARERMGEVPPEVLEGRRGMRPRSAPSNARRGPRPSPGPGASSRSGVPRNEPSRSGCSHW